MLSIPRSHPLFTQPSFSQTPLNYRRIQGSWEIFRLLIIAAVSLLSGSLLRGQEMRRVHSHVAAAVAQSQVMSEVDGDVPMRLAIGLPLRNPTELDTLLAEIADPASPNYRHYLTPAEFAARFGPTEEDYHSLMDYARSHGLTVTGTHGNRMVLDVSGPATEVSKAMHVKIMRYRHPVRREFFAPDREPTVDADVKVLDVSGLDNLELPRPMSLATAPVALSSAGPAALVTGSGPGGYFIGKDFRTAYAPGVTLTGSGQVVGLLEFDGFFAGDVTKNFAAAGLPPVTTQTVLVNGVSGAAGEANTEVILDIMMAAYMAPGLSKVMVYEGSHPNDVLNRMATDNVASQLSSSWTFSINATTEQIFKQFIAQGQTLLQASGDSGAYTNGVAPPADDPNLTVVGGTSLTTAGSGGPWASEKAWPGSGGGKSTTYAIPSYQQGMNLAASGGSSTMRNIPDVALTADVQMYLVQSNGQPIVVGGTSAAAPLWAGFMALVNQQATGTRGRIGFLNPLIYAIGNSGNFGQDLNDIRMGSNGFSATTGYDLATGWGSPAGQHLINDLTGTTSAPSFALTSSVAALTVRQGTTGTATLTVAGKNNFTGTVGLTVSGLPAGVTAAFSPASTTGTSIATLTVSSSAMAGVYALTVTGASGSLSASSPIALTVVAPGFGLVPSAAVLTVRQGSTVSDAVRVAGLNGFSGSVALSVNGLPAGVTYALSPASTSSASTVTFMASSTAPVGTYPVTVNGLSGALKGESTITLTVSPAPAFRLASSVAILPVAQGSTGKSVISVVGSNGFSSVVGLSAAGLPAGITAAFSPVSVTSSSVMTFSATSTATAGTYSVTVNGISGSLRATTVITLTVTVPSFSFTLSAPSLQIPRGTTSAAAVAIVAQGGPRGTVKMSAAGLPSGVTATFGTMSASGIIPVTFVASSTATVGNVSYTMTGVSGSITRSAMFAINVAAPGSGTSLVNLSTAYNVNALSADGTTYSGVGLDGALNGSATTYSANLIGAQETIDGTPFYFGGANALDAVTSATIGLPAVASTSLKLLAVAVNGAQAQQVFKVAYTDGTTVSFTQSLSDWFTPQGFAGETLAKKMAYRNNSLGQRDNRTFYLSEYSFLLNASKTVASVTLPNNRNVVLLAASLTASASDAR